MASASGDAVEENASPALPEPTAEDLCAGAWLLGLSLLQAPHPQAPYPQAPQTLLKYRQ
ncbi:MAG: hypothetical protein RR288_02220 [Oscillibacter sp.]